MIVELFCTEPRHCIGSLPEHPVPRQHKGQDPCSPSLYSGEERMDQGGACRPTQANVWVSLKSLCVVIINQLLLKKLVYSSFYYLIFM